MISNPMTSLGRSERNLSCRGSHSSAFQDILSGDKAFYKQTDYESATKRDLAQNKPLSEVSYTWNTEHKTTRIAKLILSIIIFPIGMYKLLHVLAGKVALLPASNPTIMRIFHGYPKDYANILRKEIEIDPSEDGWKHKRITVEVDGYKIDAMITGKASTLSNGRWMLFSQGNGEFYEEKLAGINPGTLQNDVQSILSEVKGNAIVFNYPGVGSSSGLPNRHAMEKAYRAMLNFLEDRENGIGAQEIIGYGHSIGGGVQGDALKTHELKKDINYVFIKSRTFSSMSAAASFLTLKPLGFLVKMLGWNMGSVESSKKLQAPEIIMQTVSKPLCEELSDSSLIVNDGVIHPDASLAKKLLLESQKSPMINKTFIGIREGHNDGLSFGVLFLAKKINALLQQQKSSDL